jgi:HPt (histidine-containing phosphotransfer) domain-containing protein
LQRVAHTLKASADVVGAASVVAAARKLEQIGRNQALNQAPTGLEQLEVEVHRLLRELRALLQSAALVS